MFTEPLTTLADRLFDLLDQSARAEPAGSWPPYNVERKSADEYRITMALAGFAADEIELVQKENSLTVAGHKAAPPEGGAQVLHRGIAARSFRQTFDLADHVKVTTATLEHGLLTIDLKREVPEALKPRRIDIASGAAGSKDNNVHQIEIGQSEQSKQPKQGKAG